MSNGNDSMTWQSAALAAWKYLVDHAPTIIAAIGLAAGGCWATRQLQQGQAETHAKLDEHEVKIDKTVDQVGVIKQDVKKVEARTSEKEK